MLAALPGRAWLGGLVGCRDLGTVATAVRHLAGGVLPAPIVQGPAPPVVFVRQHGRMGAPKITAGGRGPRTSTSLGLEVPVCCR